MGKYNAPVSSMPVKPPRLPKTLQEKENSKRLIVILEGACLETAKFKTGYELLNADDHKTYLIKHKKDPSDYRPDILHQCLLTVLDSPLNKAGLLEVYVHTTRNQLISVSPHTRLPRTFPRFAGLMVQLLHKLIIRASDGPMKLFQVISNPVTDHLPTGCPIIGTSWQAEVKHVHQHIKELGEDLNRPFAFVLGAFAHGDLESHGVDYIEKMVSFSQYPLSGSVACGKLCVGFENAWGIL